MARLNFLPDLAYFGEHEGPPVDALRMELAEAGFSSITCPSGSSPAWTLAIGGNQISPPGTEQPRRQYDTASAITITAEMGGAAHG
jgi:hypothetical protein